MLQTVYADVLFIIDFTMDFLALYIASYFLKMKIKTGRIIFTAIIGALYSVLTVILKFDSIIMALIFAFIMCFIAFGKRGARESIHIYVTYISVNFLLGGGMTALFSLFNSVVGERLVMIYGDVGNVQNKMPFNIFAVGTLAVTAVIMAFGRIFYKKGTAKAVKSEIVLGIRHAELTLAEDSGNMLTEHLSGEPVIFLSDKAMNKLTDEKTLCAIKNLEPDLMTKSRLKMRLTVYETVSGKEMCLCIRPDKIFINGKAVRAWIAVGKTGVFGEKDGIVPSALVRD